MAKQGREWIESSSKRRFEQGALLSISPLLGVTSLAASGLLAVRNKSLLVCNEVDRSLYPGHAFTMKKIGNPKSNDTLQRILRQAMVDEIPQAVDIMKGSMSLIGPRADTPEHINQLFDAIDNDNLREQWTEVRSLQKPGIISSYAVHSHAHNLAGDTEAARFSEDELRTQNAHLRATLDIADFEAASLRNDIALIRGTAQMALANYRAYLSR